MTSTEFAALLMLGLATSFSPGPNTTLSTALAANRGLRGALHFVVAVPIGWGLLFGLCALGLGALVVALPLLGQVVKWGGILYLLWLAHKLWRSGTLSGLESAHLDVTFGQGILLQFLNIKAWMLALSVVAGWLAGREDWQARFAITLPVMLSLAFFSNLSYALMGALLRQWLAVGSRLLWFNRGMAMVLLLTCVWLATYTLPAQPAPTASPLRATAGIGLDLRSGLQTVNSSP
jgi:threonine/homoserine/homoserine lactone efflux protein